MVMNKIELLAPAGDFECLVSALNAGADAVYFGLKDFNMRARAKNFDVKDLKKIRKLCDEKNVKMYLTLNTIVYDEELRKVESLLKKVKKFVDAVICSDVAVMLLCKKHKIEFHVSTQCSVSNIESAKFYKKLGAKRIVLARELSLKQINKIAKIVDVEVFVHGAMCVSVSGRCLISQFCFGESANKGKCIQPCRREYVIIKDNQGNELKIENNFVLSPKDLCVLPFIEKLKKAGVKSFKIEGRNKEPEYVDAVVSVYRNALDFKLSSEEIKKSMDKLRGVYNKGFSSGFYYGVPGVKDFSKVEHSSASQSKKFIGKIEHYYSKLGVGLLKLNNGPLKVGDEILIIGKTTGLIKDKIESMQIEHNDVKIVKKGQKVGIKLSFCRNGDEVYLIVKK